MGTSTLTPPPPTHTHAVTDGPEIMRGLTLSSRNSLPRHLDSLPPVVVGSPSPKRDGHRISLAAITRGQAMKDRAAGGGSGGGGSGDGSGTIDGNGDDHGVAHRKSSEEKGRGTLIIGSPIFKHLSILETREKAVRGLTRSLTHDGAIASPRAGNRKSVPSTASTSASPSSVSTSISISTSGKHKNVHRSSSSSSASTGASPSSRPEERERKAAEGT